MSIDILRSRREVNPVVTMAGVITRADVAEDLRKILGGETIIQLANAKQIDHYLKIQNESDSTNKRST